MPYSLRSWTDRDAGTDREISQAVYPEYLEDHRHPAWFPAQQLGAPREWASRYVAEDAHSRQRVAYATLWELRPRRYRFDLAVRPEWRRQGIATQLFTQLMGDAKALGATGLQARVRAPDWADDPESKALRRGCHLMLRDIGASTKFMLQLASRVSWDTLRQTESSRRAAIWKNLKDIHTAGQLVRRHAWQAGLQLVLFEINGGALSTLDAAREHFAVCEKLGRILGSHRKTSGAKARESRDTFTRL